MAIQKVIQIDVDELKALGGIDNLNKALGTTEQSTKSLRTQLREAQLEVATLSEKFGATSNQAIEAAKKAAKLKDAIGDAKTLTDAFNPDAKFKALGGALTGVAGGFSAVQGALGTLGIQSESVEKTLLKVNSAMALSQGLNALGESIDSFETLGKKATSALAGIRTGVLATGLGVFVVTLGLVVAYWDDIKKAVDKTTDSTKNLKLQQESLNKAYEDSSVKKAATDVLELRNNIDLAKKGVISKTDALKSYNEGLGKSWGSVKNLDEAEQKLTKNANAYIKATLLKAAANLALDKAAAEMLKAEETRQKKLEDFNNNFLDASVTQIRSQEQYDAEQKRIANNRKSRQQEEIKISEDTAKRQTDIAKKFLEDSKKIEKENNFTLNPDKEKTKKAGKSEAEKQAEEDKKRLLEIQANAIKETEDLKAKSELEKIKLERKRQLDEIDRIKNFEDEKNKARAEVNAEFDLKEKQLKEKTERDSLEAATKKRREDIDKKLADEQELADIQLQIDTDAKQKKIQQAQEESDLNKKKIQERYEMLDNLSYIFGAESDLGKAALIAKQALMAKELFLEIKKTITFAAITESKAVASTAAGAAETAKVGFPQNIPLLISYAAQAAGIIASVRSAIGKVKGVAGSLGGGVSSSIGGSSSVPSPTFNIAANTGVNQIAQTIAQQGNQVIKAYVVSKDVTSAQELDRNRIKATKI